MKTCQKPGVVSCIVSEHGVMVPGGCRKEENESPSRLEPKSKNVHAVAARTVYISSLRPEGLTIMIVK
jgi:hypothetical protein